MANAATAQPIPALPRPQPGAGANCRLDALVSASRPWVSRGLATPGPAPASWTSAALGGCLAELSGTGASPSLTLAFDLVHQVQRQGEPDRVDHPGRQHVLPARRSARRASTWPRSRWFGSPAGASACGPPISLPAPVRSGCWWSISVGVSICRSRRRPVWPDRRLRMGRSFLCLTVKTEDEPSLGSLVSVRAHARRIPRGDGRFVCRVHVLKDKRRGPGWSDEVWCRGTGWRALSCRCSRSSSC